MGGKEGQAACMQEWLVYGSRDQGEERRDEKSSKHKTLQISKRPPRIPSLQNMLVKNCGLKGERHVYTHSGPHSKLSLLCYTLFYEQKQLGRTERVHNLPWSKSPDKKPWKVKKIDTKNIKVTISCISKLAMSTQ